MRSGRCGQADGFGVTVMKNRPMTRVNLDKAIARMAGDDPRLTVDMRMSMANAIVGQFLPEGVVKGGTSLKFRFGEGHARYTLDLDTAWKTDLDTFLSKFRRNLANGWEGFSGELIVRPQASPRAIPFEYVMQPCDVRLSYMGRSWCTKVDGWDDIYLTQKLNLPVLPTVDQAIEWANGLIARIVGA